MPADTKPVVGFIGLGRMGGKMAKNIASGGFTVVAYDLNAEALAAAVEAGATAAASTADAIARGDIVMTSLPSSAVTVKVTEEQLLPNAGAGQIFLDMGTTEAPETRRLAAAFEAKGAFFLDAPVSGAPSPTMRVFVGGDEAAYEKSRPVLEATADPARIVHCGVSGTGQAVKATNQLGMGLVTAAFVEAIFAGVRAGADIDAIIQGVGGDDGFRKGIADVARSVKDGNADDHILKFPELPYFLTEARECGYELPLTKALRAFLEDGPRDWVDNMERPRVSFWHQLMEAAPRDPSSRQE